MKRIYEKELDILWDNYNFIIDKIGFFGMVEPRAQDLQAKFSLPFNELNRQVKNANSSEPKNKQKYALLRLRRLLNIWQTNGIVKVEGGFSFMGDDIYGSFPYFTVDNPSIMPTVKMIQKMQTKVLMHHVRENNIRDRKQLREDLIKNCKIDPNRATEIERMYGNIMARKEVNDFMQRVEFGEFVNASQEDENIY